MLSGINSGIFLKKNHTKHRERRHASLGSMVIPMETIKIGGISIEKTACLAPMASVADKAYRMICKEFHASYVVSEMISTKGLCYSDKKTAELCEISENEEPMALQLFGDDPVFFAKAVEICGKYTPSIIDINMGCPVPKIAGNGSGSALMKAPQLAVKIVQAAVQAAKCPVTVKIRKGWDENNVNAVEFAKAMEEAGASAITVHGRTRDQMYTGKADWDIIKQVKSAVSIPVIGNGDVDSIEDCEKMYKETGCDLVMIGRGSYGRPWVFEQIYQYYANGIILPEPSLDERMEVLLHHVSLIIECKGDRLGIREARKHAAWYLKGLPNAASFRNSCGQLSSYEDLKSLVKSFKEQAER